MLFPGQERSREESHYLVSVAILRVNHSCSVTPPTDATPAFAESAQMSRHRNTLRAPQTVTVWLPD